VATLWRGRAFSRSFHLWEGEILRTDIAGDVPSLEVPVYFFEGAHDYTAVTRLAQDYFEVLDAPVKGFYPFDNSAHSPLLEEPLRARQILKDDVFPRASPPPSGP
jgi:pimeloyl-ACP methyl ester carboxylesterase